MHELHGGSDGIQPWMQYFFSIDMTHASDVGEAYSCSTGLTRCPGYNQPEMNAGFYDLESSL